MAVATDRICRAFKNVVNQGSRCADLASDMKVFNCTLHLVDKDFQSPVQVTA